jgi:hypothetical protein
MLCTHFRLFLLRTILSCLLWSLSFFDIPTFLFLNTVQITHGWWKSQPVYLLIHYHLFQLLARGQESHDNLSKINVYIFVEDLWHESMTVTILSLKHSITGPGRIIVDVCYIKPSVYLPDLQKMWIQLLNLHWTYILILIVLISVQCLQSCTEGKYGANCSYNCTCMNGATCDPVNGTCTCTEGWTGLDCSTRACPDGLFGQKCLSVCQCNVDNTDMWVLSCYICTLWEAICIVSLNYTPHSGLYLFTNLWSKLK